MPPSMRPLQKRVDIKRLRDWIPEASRQRIDLTTAWQIIGSQFCGAVFTRVGCPADCERCRPEIVDCFRLEKADNPERLLTWLAKDHSARWIEVLIGEEKAGEQFPAQETIEDPYESLFPKREPANPLDELRKLYGC